MKITMIGHSTVLIETAGVSLLTDPYFSRMQPAFTRPAPPAVSKVDFGRIDGLLISHGHWDHCDTSILGKLRKDCEIVAGAASLIGRKEVKRLNPWQNTDIKGVRITATPAVHLAPTIGFVIEAEGRSIYFAGDTFYAGFFKEIHGRYKLDAALIPVTTFNIPMTMGEDQAVKAVNDLMPQMIVPIHRGIIPRLPLLRNKQSAEGFARKLLASGNKAKVSILENGESIEL